MAIIKNPRPRKREINLSGPKGNAYFLLATADNLSKQLDLGDDVREKISDEMTSSDYENLIKVFDKYFGKFVDLVYRG